MGHNKIKSLPDRTGPMLRLATAITAIVVCAFLHGQEIAYVDARSGSQPEPMVDRANGSGGQMGCGQGCVVQEPLKVDLVKMIAIDTAPPADADWTLHILGRPTQKIPNQDNASIRPMRNVEWKLRITNSTKNTLQLPTSLSWSMDLRSIAGKRSVIRLSMAMLVKCASNENQDAREMQSVVSLYGSSDSSLDIASVEPGQWMTVVGIGPGCPHPSNSSDEYLVTAGLDRVSWYRENGKSIEDAQPIVASQLSPSVHWSAEGTWAPGQPENFIRKK